MKGYVGIGIGIKSVRWSGLEKKKAGHWMGEEGQKSNSPNRRQASASYRECPTNSTHMAI